MPHWKVPSANTSTTITCAIITIQRSSDLVELGERALALRRAAAAAHHAHQHVARDLRASRTRGRARPPTSACGRPPRASPTRRARALRRARGGGARARCRRPARRQRAEIGNLHVADDGAEALDDRDRRERADDRVAHAVPQQELRLRDVRVLRRHERRVERDERRAFLREPRLPCGDRRPAVERARRAVVSVGVEAAVTAHTVRDQRLGVGAALQ